MNLRTPAGWETATLDDLYEFSNGVNADKSAYGSGIPFANVLEIITYETLTESFIPGRITLSPVFAARYQVRHGDVLFNRTSETQEEVGLSSVYLGDSEIVFGGFVFRARPKTNRIAATYASYALRARPVREQITTRGQGGIRANISQRDLKTVTVSLPTISEQRAIAEMLDDASDHIKLLERLIVKKRAIKEGQLQQLVTGRTRLPGFTGPWRSATWGEVADVISSGSTPRRSNSAYWNGNVPWVTSTELKRSLITHIPQRVTGAGVRAANLTIWPAGTFLMAITGLEAAGTRGNCGLLGINAATNQSCMAVIPNRRLDTSFLFFYYLLRGEELAFRFTQGTKQQSYTAETVRTLPIRLPSSINEQRAIAATLRDAENQIESLDARLAKARRVKIGMMQQLLTGRTRLPVKGVSL